ncbi:MAG TPA: NADPH-dependent assimilatory sulfite reductase hemoprotein subunit [Verrucomicrobiae bacterium]|nr:NADPH-dependent assimilatory sulfite reductase hemoprotein subunit [Verrucomicrobiae bacterium]
MIAPAAPAKVTHNEVIKEANPTLGGTIASTLSNPAVDRFSEDDTQFLKFHGIYQQDDRDKRKTGKFYMFMVRGRLPGGVVGPEQYLTFDRLATECANNTLRITTRQGFQFHGVVKNGLGPLMKGINEALSTTLAACGDVNRNVMASSTPSTSPLVDRVLEDAFFLSKALLPKTKAYHNIWVEGKQLDLADEEDKDFVDPLYGKSYLPRKFKVAFVIPPLNDIDIFTNDLGFIALEENGQLLGYNVLAGGGMGMSHGNAETFPRMADVLGFTTPEHVEAIAKAVLTIHRDYGDRVNRKHARLKYVVEERGADWTREELERRAGIKLAPAKPYHFTKQGDLLGWNRQFNGKSFLGLFVEMGRIQDAGEYRLKTALRKIVEQFHLETRLTPSQNIVIVNVPDALQQPINRILAEHGIAVENQGTPLRLASIACPALPTCGLALAESERLLPNVITRFETLFAEVGLAQEEIVMRMTGCPNGCARPYLAEIGFVGRAPNKYMVYLGGNESSTRLNRIWKENVKSEDFEKELRPLLTRYVQERTRGERFGDWCERVIWNETVSAPQLAPATASN